MAPYGKPTVGAERIIEAASKGHGYGAVLEVLLDVAREGQLSERAFNYLGYYLGSRVYGGPDPGSEVDRADVIAAIRAPPRPAPEDLSNPLGRV